MPSCVIIIPVHVMFLTIFFHYKTQLKETCKYLPRARIVWNLSFTCETQAFELGEFSGKDMNLYLAWFQ